MFIVWITLAIIGSSVLGALALSASEVIDNYRLGIDARDFPLRTTLALNFKYVGITPILSILVLIGAILLLAYQRIADLLFSKL